MDTLSSSPYQGEVRLYDQQKGLGFAKITADKRLTVRIKAQHFQDRSYIPQRGDKIEFFFGQKIA